DGALCHPDARRLWCRRHQGREPRWRRDAADRPDAACRHGPGVSQYNRSKRSIALDLKKPAGRDAALRLIASADVLIYNVRPQAMARLQLGYDEVSRINPSLIYGGAFGFGQD